MEKNIYKLNCSYGKVSHTLKYIIYLTYYYLLLLLTRFWTFYFGESISTIVHILIKTPNNLYPDLTQVLEKNCRKPFPSTAGYLNYFLPHIFHYWTSHISIILLVYMHIVKNFKTYIWLCGRVEKLGSRTIKLEKTVEARREKRARKSTQRVLSLSERIKSDWK